MKDDCSHKPATHYRSAMDTLAMISSFAGQMTKTIFVKCPIEDAEVNRENPYWVTKKTSW